jgi:hypothetical protein
MTEQDESANDPPIDSLTEKHLLETYRSMISIAMEALRSLLFLNGGAVVALLTYLGQLSGENRSTVATQTRYGFYAFAAGLTFAMLGFLFAYLTQDALLNEDYGRVDVRLPHQRWQWSAIIVGALSLLSFVFGAYMAISALAGS